ncbi:hypothetical protein QX233_07190 [Chryseobacterium gambrini]|uniref:Uncharacterized protein n=1 Tax=Chryseobacterium gambrini TaxID=373672 RepID=A0AAJ1R1P2_9FLAO|nr:MULTISPECIES: hypothetical protein [Chryseobacterium]MDN4012236.1 hypothetical protein [Chryseobacterium gambrini]MDN4031454.1 hypothetical protein [Chryseobacterium gambrini]QWA36891.1 hypothetical protein KKI44_13180 [Chryseobacterium sp. ZHDP1]
MKANTIIVSFNNGSVPPQYAYRYQIIFSEQDGNAELKIFRGYETDEKMIVSEQRKFNTEIFLQLLSLISKIKDSVKDPLMVGGSQRIIEVNSKKIEIHPDDDFGISLFNRFLYLYNPDFINQINSNLNL